MTAGPGKYDDLCTLVREQAGIHEEGVGADRGGAIVIVIGGSRGDGFSVQADFATTITLPNMLESIAAQIRADMGMKKP